jgi:hypothetical protein
VIVTLDNPNGMDQFRYRAEDPRGDLGPFYVWREDAGLVASTDPRATVDLRQLIDPEEWDAEYGGAVTYAELVAAVEKAGR